MMQRQGQVGPDGTPTRRKPPPRQAQRPVRERTSARDYGRQVRSELRKVAWPTRPEVLNYSIVVLVALVLLMFLIFGLDYVFGKAVFYLFQS
jgi:preprotein translocase subunit SecE